MEALDVLVRAAIEGQEANPKLGQLASERTRIVRQWVEWRDAIGENKGGQGQKMGDDKVEQGSGGSPT